MKSKKLNKNSILNLFDCYKIGFEPPKWTKDIDIKFMKECKAFYHHKDSLSTVKKLVKYREPVNIEMKRYYSQSKLYKYFKYKQGYYGKSPKSYLGITPPNFAIYTPTPVFLDNNIKYEKIHILNTIGLAFDNVKQRDYLEYMKLSSDKLGTNIIHIESCKKFYEDLFRLIFESTLILKKKIIIMSLVGANNFAKLWYGGPKLFLNEIWLPLFHKIAKEYIDIKILFMGTNGLVKNYKDLGYFPNILENLYIKNKLDQTLIINAWDCWSVPGNGNNMDNSLDGHIGRLTQISVNGTSLTNKWLKFIKI